MNAVVYRKSLENCAELNATALDTARQFIAENWPRITSVTLNSAADIACLSPFYFHRLFKLRFGATPKQVVRDHQITEAKRLLLADVDLIDIPKQCGFASDAHFCTVFKQVVGIPPGRWRRRQRQASKAEAVGGAAGR